MEKRETKSNQKQKQVQLFDLFHKELLLRLLSFFLGPQTSSLKTPKCVS